MTFQFAECPKAKQAVQQSAVGNVDLGSLHLPLGNIFMPGKQLTHNQRRRQHVEIVAHGRVGNAGKEKVSGTVFVELVLFAFARQKRFLTPFLRPCYENDPDDGQRKGIESTPALVAEIKQIAREWGIQNGAPVN